MIQTEQVIQEVKKMIKGKDTSICKVFAAMLAGGYRQAKERATEKPWQDGPRRPGRIHQCR